MMAQTGEYVVINYTGKLDNGEVFDSTEGRDPFEFQVGSGSVISGFESAVLEMNINDMKDVVIEAIDAYGEYNDELVMSFPIEEMREQFEPQQGMIIGVPVEGGGYSEAVVTKITDSEVFIDLNHPLAGQRLHFNIQLMEINSEPKYNTGSCDCGCDCSDDEHGCC